MPQTTTIELVLGAVSLVAAALAIVALVRLRAVRRDLLLARGPHDEPSIIGAVADQARRIEELRHEVEVAQQQLAVARRDLSAALRHVSVVRYDAFGDMGGRMSFSAALLDDNGDGVILSSIHGHTESRMYVKTVSNRTADGRVSPEELEAIATASPIG